PRIAPAGRSSGRHLTCFKPGAGRRAFSFFQAVQANVQTVIDFHRHALYPRQAPQPFCFVYLDDLDDRPRLGRAGDDRGVVGDEWLPA
ncbi:hypothetical protein CEJ63_26985, partial [Acinetobacter baumannii]